MSTNTTASSNTGQSVPVHEEEHTVSKHVTDDEGVTTLTTVPKTEDEAFPIDEFCWGEDATRDAQEGWRLTMSADETWGDEGHQKERQFK